MGVPPWGAYMVQVMQEIDRDGATTKQLNTNKINEY